MAIWNLSVLFGTLLLALIGCSEVEDPVNMRPKLNEARLGPELTRWCNSADPHAQLTVIVRTRKATMLDVFNQKMTNNGITIESSGRGGTTMIVTCDQLALLSNEDEVVSIAPPRELNLKSPQ